MRFGLIFLFFSSFLCFSQFDKEVRYPINYDFPIDSAIIMNFPKGWEYIDTDVRNKYKQKVEYFIYNEQDTIQLKRYYHKTHLFPCIKFQAMMPFKYDLLYMKPNYYYHYVQPPKVFAPGTPDSVIQKEKAQYEYYNGENIRKNKEIDKKVLADSLKHVEEVKKRDAQFTKDSLNVLERNAQELVWENQLKKKLHQSIPISDEIDICIEFQKDSTFTMYLNVSFDEVYHYQTLMFSFSNLSEERFQMIYSLFGSLRLED
jgi:hypothetical protein